jgi:hypothetical protein
MFLHHRPPRDKTEFDAIVVYRESPTRKFNRTSIYTAARFAVARFAIGQVRVGLDRAGDRGEAIFGRKESSHFAMDPRRRCASCSIVVGTREAVDLQDNSYSTRQTETRVEAC